ncbi:uncharacterized protein LOC114411294 [Glycine soja]|uniref:uncharacterized protein n=1 Tax=Glycine max TaxID=3847 RepID=UPI0003DE9A89|nr:uncharacterized protein LOC102670247 [Glycine max]XP_028230818.1 uncharacterized protein LOC114411294 [Glycine soja]|eukprot:XP_006580807.1 uncharacterized protein LOC102670247 [Glycine max]
MSLYKKCLKDLLIKKGKYINSETIMVGENCSAVIQKLPPKFKDSRSVTIPCSIRSVSVGKALIDLGASINLMSLSMCKRIGNLKIKPTRITLQLADHSITRPVGVVEDFLIKVHQLPFPVDFLIMDIEEDVEIPLILGRSFMVTAKCVMDMGKGNLEMSVEDQKATFNLFEASKHPSDSKTCFKVEEIEQKANLTWGHLNSVFLEEDEAKPVVNPTNSSSIFLGPKQAKTRTTPDIPPTPPSAVPPPDVSPPPIGQTSIPFSHPEQLLPVLYSLYHSQYLLM